MIGEIDKLPVEVHLVEMPVGQVEIVVREFEVAQFHIRLPQPCIDVDELLLGQPARVDEVERLPVIISSQVVRAAADIYVGQVRIACQQHLAVVCQAAVIEHSLEIFERRVVLADDGITVSDVVVGIGQQIMMPGCQRLLAGAELQRFLAKRDDGVELGGCQVGLDIEVVKHIPVDAVFDGPRPHGFRQEPAGEERVGIDRFLCLHVDGVVLREESGFLLCSFMRNA